MEHLNQSMSAAGYKVSRSCQSALEQHLFNTQPLHLCHGAYIVSGSLHHPAVHLCMCQQGLLCMWLGSSGALSPAADNDVASAAGRATSSAKARRKSRFFDENLWFPSRCKRTAAQVCALSKKAFYLYNILLASWSHAAVNCHAFSMICVNLHQHLLCMLIAVAVMVWQPTVDFDSACSWPLVTTFSVQPLLFHSLPVCSVGNAVALLPVSRGHTTPNHHNSRLPSFDMSQCAGIRTASCAASNSFGAHLQELV